MGEGMGRSAARCKACLGFGVALAVLSVAAFAVADEAPIAGRASVIDGDTIEIHGTRIRLNGIDAPEAGQLCHDSGGRSYRCGRVAAEALDAFLAAARPTRCTFVTRDRWGRYVGDCRRADGASAQEFLVEEGHALDWPRYSGGAYARAQEVASTARRGLWAGRFDAPWDWRAAH